MSGSSVFIVLVVMIVGGYVGWHIRHAQGANADLKVNKARIPNFRRARNRSGLTVLAVVVLALLVLHALLK